MRPHPEISVFNRIRNILVRPKTLVLAVLCLSLIALTQLPIWNFGARTVFAQQIPSDAGEGVSRPSAQLAVKYLFPEQLSVVAGKSTTADLHFRITSGLHINSHKPYEKNLIPTNLVIVEEPGLKVASVDFPAGKDFAFTFAPTEKISVYSDEFILHAHLTAERGDHLLRGALRYQACDASTCFPPKTIPVAIDIIAK